MAQTGLIMIIGRKRELTLLDKIYNSTEAEFMVVYGRRRVGKTFLIREYFENKKCIFFNATGLQKGNMQKQLHNFTQVIAETFFDNAPLEPAKSWNEAFKLIHQKVIKSKKKVVLFLDEIPWMATRKSGLLEEIDYFWNQYWSRQSNLIFILCGSSASWLIKKIIYNKGGLHNRVTCQIKLKPFDLSETQAYLKSRKINLNMRHILSLYMAIGGIPYYLRYVEPNLTAEQNIQKIFFDENAPLKEEFDKLFASLFKNADAYIELVRLIAMHKEGVKRSDLESLAARSTNGGRLSKRLKDLSATGFIEEFIPWSRSKGEYYKLIDEFSLFYLHWIDLHKNEKFIQNHWLHQSQRPAYYAWSGYAFEAICLKHIEKITSALNIATGATVGSWRYNSKTQEQSGAQIDLVIDRNDNAITLIEVKYTTEPFVINKSYAKNLQTKIEIFKNTTGTKKHIFMSIICANGLKPNMYSEELINGVVTLEELF